ncbi:DUF4435 domain-containing protein [Pyxidicoccus sp. MSG2]|uniref:DUF4435 domain-containing protein n=1 Tax=Pyxidicoccus sp. MSG2 TaxID=2996790 RepID=UPI00226DC939|nr:DUF4435 domain-containing protein [Pyxidicoccus sp. MSG2]MCY1016962.1 DUF4435 domain-containing protein [Pyxidicoccus sp. MSG2]
MLKWPAKALESIATLFQPLQDIDVYVEDEGSEIFYLELLSRLTDGEFKIVRVLPLGGRKRVIEKCQSAQGNGRPSIFIIDGDLEWVRGGSPPPLKGLYHHDAYCIENYLFCATAATELIAESHGKLSRQQARDLLSWDSFLSQTITPLVELFCVFAAAQKLAPSVPTVSRGVGAILTPSRKGAPSQVDKDRLNQLRNEVSAEVISATGKEAFDAAVKEISDRVNSLSAKHSAISGKDFLLPLLRFRIITLAKSQHPDDSFRFRLAKHCSLERLTPLKSALKSAAQKK